MTGEEKAKYDISREISRINQEIQSIRILMSNPYSLKASGQTKQELLAEIDDLRRERNQLLTNL